MQWKWKAWLQTPIQEQTMVSLLVTERTNFMYINFELHIEHISL